jgi:hypothetical protein
MRHRWLTIAKTAYEKTALQRQIDATGQQKINALVYEFYGLTKEEINET